MAAIPPPNPQAKQASGLAGGLAMRDLIRFLDNHFSLLHSCALEVATTKPEGATGAASGGGGGGGGGGGAEDWTPEQQAALQQALKDVPATMEAGERWKKIAELVPGKSKKECVARFKALKAALAGVGGQQQQQQQQQGADGEWTDSQQEALQSGLKEHPQGGILSGEERWTAIAAMVPGKTARQCAERYRELREKILAVAKEAPAAAAGGAGKGGVKKRDEGRINVQTIKFEVEVEKEEVQQEVATSNSDDNDDDDDDDDDDDGGGEEMEFQPLPEGASVGACQVKLNDLMLLGAGAAQALVASVQCACSRCGECYAMSLARGGEEEELECKRCKRPLTMALHSDMLHSEVGGSCMGWIEVRGCKVVDVLRLMLLASCQACSNGSPPSTNPRTIHRR